MLDEHYTIYSLACPTGSAQPQRNTDKIEHVMIGGRLYEADTMNEVHTGNAKGLPYWWE